MKCTFCGTEFPDYAKFCPTCGNAAEKDEKEEIVYEQTVMDDGFAKQQEQNDFADRGAGSGNNNSYNRFGGYGSGTFCTHCGAHIDYGVQYCPRCGAKANGGGFGDSDEGYSPERVGFVESYKRYWKNYFNFHGRASVGEYWFVVLWNILIGILAFVVLLVGACSTVAAGDGNNLSPGGLTFLYLVIVAIVLFGLANIIPDISLTVRRLHDTGRSGFMIFIGLVPTIGTIILLVLLLGASQPYKNQYN